MAENNNTSQPLGSLAFSTAINTAVTTPLWLFFDHPKKKINGTSLRGVYQIHQVSDIKNVIEESGLQTQENVIEYEWLLSPIGENPLKSKKKKMFYQISNSTLEFFRENQVKEMKLLVCSRDISPPKNAKTIPDEIIQPMIESPPIKEETKERKNKKQRFIETTQEEELEADLDGGKCDFLSNCEELGRKCALPHKYSVVFFAAGLVVGFIIAALLATLAVALVR